MSTGRKSQELTTLDMFCPAVFSGRNSADLLLYLRPLVSRRVGLTISPAEHGPNIAVDRQAKSAYDYSWLGFVSLLRSR